VVTPPAAYAHPLLRRSPRTGVAHAMAHRALRRRPLSATARALLSDRSLPRRLRQQAAALEAVRRDRAPDFGWGPPPALREAAESTEPLGSDRGTHAWVHQARLAGIGVRTPPFTAHAWVEADGRPVGEPADITAYRTIISVRPPRRRQAC
jgi:asparagine synthase (glutamine-hydrolysing)